MTPRADADLLAGFARLMAGVWRQPSPAGPSMIHTWHWGPDRKSVRRLTDGFGAAGEPWREVQVFYADPARKTVRLLGLSPYAEGVSEGTITVTEDGAEGVCDLYQANGVHRKIGLRWSFDGPDRYRETLLEARSSGRYEPLVTFEHLRIRPADVPRTPHAALPPSRLPKALLALQGTWDAPAMASQVVWIPYADALSIRSTTAGAHRLDAYLYRHTGHGALRCLALLAEGPFHGTVTVRPSGGLELDLTGARGRRYTTRFDRASAGVMRQRTWSGQTRLHDLRHDQRR